MIGIGTKLRWVMGVVTPSSSLAQVAGAAPRRSGFDPGPSDRFALTARTRQPLRAGQFGGGFGGNREDVAITSQFDTNADGRLDATERRSAREYAESMGLTVADAAAAACRPRHRPGHPWPRSPSALIPRRPSFDPRSFADRRRAVLAPTEWRRP